MKSQVKVTPLVIDFSKDIPGKDFELIKNILKKIHRTIKKIELDDHEKDIRWKRNATEILLSRKIVIEMF